MNPFTDHPDQSIAAWGESVLIEHIVQWMGDRVPPPPHGIGDDAAVLPPPPDGFQLVMTADALVWRSHFDASASPEQAGRKLANRNLSDLAAMGARPGFFILTLQLGKNVSKTWIQWFFHGFHEACQRHEVKLVGGDISSAPASTFSASVTAGGFAKHPMFRTGGQAGDSIWVTGSLGGSRQGKHLDFSPRVQEGLWLAERAAVHAMIDLTDGLAKDLPALVPNGLQAAVRPSAIPLSADALQTSPNEEAALHAALTEGEDFELLFCLSSAIPPAQFIEEWEAAQHTPITCIGMLIPANPQNAPPLWDSEKNQPLSDVHLEGYEHFRAN